MTLKRPPSRASIAQQHRQYAEHYERRPEHAHFYTEEHPCPICGWHPSIGWRRRCWGYTEGELAWCSFMRPGCLRRENGLKVYWRPK
jgi:hypothetical protein